MLRFSHCPDYRCFSLYILYKWHYFDRLLSQLLYGMQAIGVQCEYEIGLPGVFRQRRNSCGGEKHKQMKHIWKLAAQHDTVTVLAKHIIVVHGKSDLSSAIVQRNFLLGAGADYLALISPVVASSSTSRSENCESHSLVRCLGSPVTLTNKLSYTKT